MVDYTILYLVNKSVKCYESLQLSRVKFLFTTSLYFFKIGMNDNVAETVIQGVAMSSVHYNLPKRIETELALMAEKYNISKITLFGSRARGDNTEKSDVDIAVYGCEDFARFSLDVEDEVWTLLKFDIVDMDGNVSEELRDEIQRDGVVIYEKI